MKTLYLAHEDAATLKSLYAALDGGLCFPSYFGYNLDALYDVLTDLCEETHISLPEGAAPAAAIVVLRDAERHNPCLHVHIRRKGNFF